MNSSMESQAPDPVIQIHFNKDERKCKMSPNYSALEDSFQFVCYPNNDPVVDLDMQTDMPERYQMQSIPVSGATSAEIEEETLWICNKVFWTTDSSYGDEDLKALQVDVSMALRYIRNDQLEVPFIWLKYNNVFHSIDRQKLWKVCRADQEYRRLGLGKKALKKMLEQIQTCDEDSHRPLTYKEYNSVENVSSFEELKDMFMFVKNFYGDGVALTVKNNKQADQVMSAEEKLPILKAVKLFDFNSISKFIAGPSVCVVEEHGFEPLEPCIDLVTSTLPTPKDVLEVLTSLAACQFASDPVIRKAFREAFTNSFVTVRPTPSGFIRIDENHPVFPLKYLTKKPVNSFKPCEFLKLTIAEKNEFIRIQFTSEKMPELVEHIRKLCTIETVNYFSRKWNQARLEAIQMALETVLIPFAVLEFREALLEKDFNYILDECALTLRRRLAVGPYKPQLSFEQRQNKYSKCLRVVSVAYDQSENPSCYAAFVNRYGEMKIKRAYQSLLMDKRYCKRTELESRCSDLEGLKKFIMKTKPHIVVIGGNSKVALNLHADIEGLVSQLNKEGKSPLINVEILDAELAKLYANSEKGEEDFPGYPDALKEAVSLARLIQDPLIAYAQLDSEELMYLRYHEYQSYVPKDKLQERIDSEFMDQVSQIGVDINRAIAFPHTSALLQYISGLGPIAADALVENIKDSGQWIEDSLLLTTIGKLGLKVCENCADFIKIHTKKVAEGSLEFHTPSLKDCRLPYESPGRTELFEMLMKVPVNKVNGKLFQCTVLGPLYFKPDTKSARHSCSEYNRQTKMYQCVFCKNEFKTTFDFVGHFNCETSERCPGELKGYKVKLSCGVSGFIATRRLSEQPGYNPHGRLKKGYTVMCRVGHVDLETMTAECSLRTADLCDMKGRFNVERDEYFDYDQECKFKEKCVK